MRDVEARGIGSRVQSQSLSAKGGGTAASTAVMPYQIRGRSFTAVVLQLVGVADQAFYTALDALLRQAPHFFTNAPFVIDLDKATNLQLNGDFTRLVRELRGRKLSVIGVQNGSIDQNAAALTAGLITLQGGRDVPTERDGRPAVVTTAAAEPGPATMLVTEPVRSGQRIFADRGDLVVVAAVSSGAELIAHGSIHVYGRLRGRALAGVNGDKTARIFCQSLEAELVAIAGLYRTSDDLGPAVRQQRVQAFLRDETMCIEPLK
jgi:septum site-determining protein MinC